MGNRLQMMGWEFEKEELCFKCRIKAPQRIRVTPSELMTQCTHCGAEPHYALYGSRVVHRKPAPALNNALDRTYGIWRFKTEAKCPRCGNEARQDMAVDVAMASITCDKCLFTRVYKFDAFNRCWRR